MVFLAFFIFLFTGTDNADLNNIDYDAEFKINNDFELSISDDSDSKYYIVIYNQDNDDRENFELKAEKTKSKSLKDGSYDLIVMKNSDDLLKFEMIVTEDCDNDSVEINYDKKKVYVTYAEDDEDDQDDEIANDSDSVDETTTPHTSAPAETIAQSTTASSAQTENTYITELEIISLYTESNKLFQGWLDHGWEAKNQDLNDYITVNNMRYNRLLSGRFSSVDELQIACSQYFESCIYKTRITNNYQMHDGKFYANEGLGQGGADFYDSFTLYVEESTPDYCRFSISCYEGSTPSYTYENEIKKINDRWIFVNNFKSNYTLYFNENIEWKY
ncbi:MAG: hypothetical protein IJ289_08165 [Clostridia bacterium]|nr:hypothetical protein [Clostridia bacterium]